MSAWLAPWPVPPAAILIFAAPLLAALTGRMRQVVLVLAPAAAVWQVASLFFAEAPSVHFEWMGYDVDLLATSRIRLLFGLIFAIMSLIGSIYALHVKDTAQHVAGFVYAGGALGVTFSGDFLGFVLFWEAMGLSSVVLVFSRRTRASYGAGLRYVAFHALGGTVLVVGVALWAAQGNGLAVTAIAPGAGLAAWLILIGVVVNAAVPPLGAWLPDAYGEGTVTGSVFLSAFTTKTAVFALLVLFPGWEILLWGGVVMALYGVVYAVLENNIRRLLAYHIISQVGYMVAAAGMGTSMAIDGGSAHAFSHILYKSLLFMGAGAVVYATGKEKLTELGGLFRTMWLPMSLYAVGAASISGFPLFNGFISKSIVVSAAGQGGWPAAELGLTLASVGTFLHTGLKLLWFTFVTPVDKKHEVLRPLPKNMYVAMFIGAFLCTFLGFPWGGYQALYAILPNLTDYHPYTVHHVLQSVQLLVMTALCFWWMFDKLWGQKTVSLDTDWIYRRPLPPLVLGLSRGVFSAQEALGRGIGVVIDRGVTFMRNPLRGAERLFGRGIFVLSGQDEAGAYSEHVYRVSLGTAVLFVLGLFAAVALVLLAVG